MPNNNYDAYARSVARRFRIPVPIFFGLGDAESERSHYRPDGSLVKSPAGAIGWGQLMPDTAKELGVDPTKPRQNILGAAKYLSQQFAEFGDWRRALAAYNAGPGRVQDGSWLEIPETVAYVKKVLGSAKQFKGGSGGSAMPSAAAPLGFELPVPTATGSPSSIDAVLNTVFERNRMRARGQNVDPGLQLPQLLAAIASPAEPEAQATGGTTVPPLSKKTGAPPGTTGKGDPTVQRILQIAHAQIGKPYVWGGESPSEGGFDCSGLLMYAFEQAGVALPGRPTTYTMATMGRSVKREQYRPGDWVITNGGKHVVMYVGNGQVIAAPHRGAVVRYQPLSDFKGQIMDVRRVL